MKKLLLALVTIMLIATPVFAADITLRWTDNSNNEDGFRVERKVDAGVYAPLVSTGVDIVTYVDNTLTIDPLVDKTYCYRLSAFNSTGSSGLSNEACATFKKPAPGVPAIVDITCTNCTVTINGKVITIP